jgi:hypothetical protein
MLLEYGLDQEPFCVAVVKEMFMQNKFEPAIWRAEFNERIRRVTGRSVLGG